MLYKWDDSNQGYFKFFRRDREWLRLHAYLYTLHDSKLHYKSSSDSTFCNDNSCCYVLGDVKTSWVCADRVRASRLSRRVHIHEPYDRPVDWRSLGRFEPAHIQTRSKNQGLAEEFTILCVKLVSAPGHVLFGPRICGHRQPRTGHWASSLLG